MVYDYEHRDYNNFEYYYGKDLMNIIDYYDLVHLCHFLKMNA